MDNELKNSIAGERLLAFIERIERVEHAIKDEQEARKEIYAEAKGVGYDPKIIRKVVAIRKMDKLKREEEKEMLDLYMGALQQLDLLAE